MALYPPLFPSLVNENGTLVLYIGKANDPEQVRIDPYINQDDNDSLELFLKVGDYEWSKKTSPQGISATIFDIGKNVFEKGLAEQSDAKLSYSITKPSGNVEYSMILTFVLKP